MPVVCSVDDALISPIRSVMRRTWATTSSMVAPASPTSVEPASTLLTLSPIRPLISRAACAERCARLRTSEATTAKPRPCSPARAASTAALSARMLVWNAMPSITPMMSAIFLLDALISLIVATTRCTTWPPLPATSAAAAASWPAARELSALCWTVVVICCIEAAVSCNALACCSVRLDRSWLPDAICDDAVAMPSADWRTWLTIVTRLPFIRLNAASSWPVSSLRSTTMWELRSPAATASASTTQRSSGRVTADASIQPMASAISTAAPHTAASIVRSLA